MAIMGNIVTSPSKPDSVSKGDALCRLSPKKVPKVSIKSQIKKIQFQKQKVSPLCQIGAFQAVQKTLKNSISCLHILLLPIIKK